MRPSPTQFQTCQLLTAPRLGEQPMEGKPPLDHASHRYGYEVLEQFPGADATQPPLLLIHPIGVGLSRRFWDRFCTDWQQRSQGSVPGQPAPGQPAPGNVIYNPDLLGCGDSDMPCWPYRPVDWARQLQQLIETVIQRPVIVVVQGALFPVAIELVKLAPNSVVGLVLSGPPAWQVMVDVATERQQNLAWALFKSPLGALFYRYARRRQFLEDFSRKQLFARDSPIDPAWLDPLVAGARDPASRHAVFAFLARFWQQGYGEEIRAIAQPTLALFGQEASSVSRSGKSESPQDRLQIYLDALPAGQGALLPGRNLLPFEATTAFGDAVARFVATLGA